MPRSDDKERSKKSWREIDKQRESSAHRRSSGGAPASERLEQSQAYRAYKTQLNKLFEGGALPEVLQGKLAAAGVAAPAQAQTAQLRAVSEANTPTQLVEALALYRAAYGFPVDEAVLAKIVDVAPVPELVVEALQAVARLVADKRLKRAAAWQARLKSVRLTWDDAEIADLAGTLLAQLKS